MSNERDDASNRWATPARAPRNEELPPNAIDLDRVNDVVLNALPSATAAMRNANTGTIKRQLIPIYLRMDNELASAGEEVACRAGCSYCCYYHVAVTAVEALALAEHLQGLPQTKRDHLTRKLHETAQRVAPLSEAEYIHTNIPCAFLEEGRCSVYEARPVACRGFNSVSVDPCRVAFEDPHSTDPMTFAPDRQAVNEAYKSVMLAAQHRAGCDATTYEMHTAVAEALTNSSAMKRWKKGKVAFTTVADRTSLQERLERQGGS